MENDPLQQLRPLQLPAEPAWWPPAFGWWIVAALVLGSIAWMIYKLIRAYRRRAPIRSAKQLLNELHATYERGDINAMEYLHQGNEILKRLLVRAYGRSIYAGMSGTQWLIALDEITSSDSFSNGPGQVLGDARFSANPKFDTGELRAQFELVIKKVKP